MYEQKLFDCHTYRDKSMGPSWGYLGTGRSHSHKWLQCGGFQSSSCLIQCIWRHWGSCSPS